MRVMSWLTTHRESIVNGNNLIASCQRLEPTHTSFQVVAFNLKPIGSVQLRKLLSLGKGATARHDTCANAAALDHDRFGSIAEAVALLRCFLSTLPCRLPTRFRWGCKASQCSQCPPHWGTDGSVSVPTHFIPIFAVSHAPATPRCPHSSSAPVFPNRRTLDCNFVELYMSEGRRLSAFASAHGDHPLPHEPEA